MEKSQKTSFFHKMRNGKLYFIISILALTLVASIIVAVFVLGADSSRKEKEKTEKKDTVSNPPEVENFVSSTEDVLNFKIEFSKPQLVKDNASLFKKGSSQNAFDPDETKPYQIYKMGNVLSGTAEVDGVSTDFKDYDYNVAISSEMKAGPGTPAPVLRFFSRKNDINTMYVDNMSSYIYKDQLTSDLYGLEDSLSVKILDIDFPQSSFSPIKFEDYSTTLVTDSNVKFETKNFRPFLHDQSKATKIDTIEGEDVYMLNDDNKITYIVSTDHLQFELTLLPSLVTDNKNPKLQIEWEPGETKTDSYYDYIGIGGCFGGLEVTSDFVEDKFKIVGYDKNGKPVYSPPSDLPFLVKIYNEDYIDTNLNTTNSLKTDDSSAFDYDTFLQYHPLVYWEDEYGRFIRFASRDFVITGGCAKPIIYLYPENKIDVSVSVTPKNGNLTFSLPTFNADNSWYVNVDPTGEIDASGSSYEYLWWESNREGEKIDLPYGFVVPNSELKSSINSHLKKLGLSEKERTDFLEYWIPIMEKESKSYFKISYLIDDEVSEIADLSINPKPTSVRRVFMLFEGLDSVINIVPQSLTGFDRKGFVVVEWGGAKQ